jgi:hypothetical protein
MFTAVNTDTWFVTITEEVSFSLPLNFMSDTYLAPAPFISILV